MEATILTKRNAHRAAVVRQIANPEYGDWRWEWRGQPLNKGFFGCTNWAHVAGEGSNSVVVGDSELHFWEVVSWKYEVSLEELWDIACRAFNGTSFSPEERGAHYIRDYETALNSDLQSIPQEEQERYIAKFKELVRALFDKHSRCLSSMITGPANFPTRRSEKANNSYDNAVAEFSAWREKALKSIAKRIEDAKPKEQKADEAWAFLRRDIISSAATIKGINNGTERGCNKALFVSSIFNKVGTYANKGDVAMVERAIALVRELNQQSSIITERHKFFKLIEVAQNTLQRAEAKASKDPAQVSFDDGVVVKNFQEDRLQIIFKEKPSQDVIAKLKRNGFKWSPRFMAWQRQLTLNSFYGAAEVIPVTVEQLKNA